MYGLLTLTTLVFLVICCWLDRPCYPGCLLLISNWMMLRLLDFTGFRVGGGGCLLVTYKRLIETIYWADIIWIKCSLVMLTRGPTMIFFLLVHYTTKQEYITLTHNSHLRALYIVYYRVWSLFTVRNMTEPGSYLHSRGSMKTEKGNFSIRTKALSLVGPVKPVGPQLQ